MNQSLDVVVNTISQVAYALGYTFIYKPRPKGLGLNIRHYHIDCEIDLEKHGSRGWVVTSNICGKFCQPSLRQVKTATPIVVVLAIVASLPEYELRTPASSGRQFYRLVAEYLKENKIEKVSSHHLSSLFAIFKDHGFVNSDLEVVVSNSETTIVVNLVSRIELDEKINEDYEQHPVQDSTYLQQQNVREALSLSSKSVKACLIRLSKLRKFNHLSLPSIPISIKGVTLDYSIPKLEWLGESKSLDQEWIRSAVKEIYEDNDCLILENAIQSLRGGKFTHQLLENWGYPESSLMSRRKVITALIQRKIKLVLPSSYEVTECEESFTIKYKDVSLQGYFDAQHYSIIRYRDIGGKYILLAILPLYIAETVTTSSYVIGNVTILLSSYSDNDDLIVDTVKATFNKISFSDRRLFKKLEKELIDMKEKVTVEKWKDMFGA